MATLASQISLAVAEPKVGVAGQLIGLAVGQVMFGGVISITAMVMLQLAELPQSSVAVQVRVIVYVPAQGPAIELSLNEIVTVPSQASVAVASIHTGVNGQLIGVT